MLRLLDALKDSAQWVNRNFSEIRSSLIQYQEAQPRLTELPTMDTNSNINKTRVRLYIFRYRAGPSRLLDWAGILGISFTLPMYPTLLCEHTSLLFTL